MEPIHGDQLSDLNLQVDEASRQHLSLASKWSKFMAIVIFCFCGLLVIFAFVAGPAIMKAAERYFPAGFSNEINGGIIIGLIIFVAAVVTVVYYFLYNFSVKIKKELLSENSEEVTAAFASLKMFFILTTIFAGLGLITNLYNLYKTL